MKDRTDIVVLLLLFVLFFSFAKKDNKYWKDKYIQAQIWADSLYDENLRLADTITYLRLHECL